MCVDGLQGLTRCVDLRLACSFHFCRRSNCHATFDTRMFRSMASSAARSLAIGTDGCFAFLVNRTIETAVGVRTPSDLRNPLFVSALDNAEIALVVLAACPLLYITVLQRLLARALSLCKHGFGGPESQEEERGSFRKRINLGPVLWLYRRMLRKRDLPYRASDLVDSFPVQVECYVCLKTF